MIKSIGKFTDALADRGFYNMTSRLAKMFKVSTSINKTSLRGRQGLATINGKISAVQVVEDGGGDSIKVVCSQHSPGVYTIHRDAFTEGKKAQGGKLSLGELKNILSPDEYESLFEDGHPSAWTEYSVGNYTVMWNPSEGVFETRRVGKKAQNFTTPEMYPVPEEEIKQDMKEWEDINVLVESARLMASQGQVISQEQYQNLLGRYGDRDPYSLTLELVAAGISVMSERKAQWLQPGRGFAETVDGQVYTIDLKSDMSATVIKENGSELGDFNSLTDAGEAIERDSGSVVWKAPDTALLGREFLRGEGKSPFPPSGEITEVRGSRGKISQQDSTPSLYDEPGEGGVTKEVEYVERDNKWMAKYTKDLEKAFNSEEEANQWLEKMSRKAQQVYGYSELPSEQKELVKQGNCPFCSGSMMVLGAEGDHIIMRCKECMNEVYLPFDIFDEYINPSLEEQLRTLLPQGKKAQAGEMAKQWWNGLTSEEKDHFLEQPGGYILPERDFDWDELSEVAQNRLEKMYWESSGASKKSQAKLKPGDEIMDADMLSSTYGQIGEVTVIEEGKITIMMEDGTSKIVPEEDVEKELIVKQSQSLSQDILEFEQISNEMKAAKIQFENLIAPLKDKKDELMSRIRPQMEQAENQTVETEKFIARYKKWSQKKAVSYKTLFEEVLKKVNGQIRKIILDIQDSMTSYDTREKLEVIMKESTVRNAQVMEILRGWWQSFKDTLYTIWEGMVRTLEQGNRDLEDVCNQAEGSPDVVEGKRGRDIWKDLEEEGEYFDISNFRRGERERLALIEMDKEFFGLQKPKVSMRDFISQQNKGDWLSPEDVAKLCPDCAKYMKAHNMGKISKSYLEEKMGIDIGRILKAQTQYDKLVEIAKDLYEKFKDGGVTNAVIEKALSGAGLETSPDMVSQVTTLTRNLLQYVGKKKGQDRKKELEDQMRILQTIIDNPSTEAAKVTAEEELKKLWEEYFRLEGKKAQGDFIFEVGDKVMVKETQEEGEIGNTFQDLYVVDFPDGSYQSYEGDKLTLVGKKAQTGITVSMKNL